MGGLKPRLAASSSEKVVRTERRELNHVLHLHLNLHLNLHLHHPRSRTAPGVWSESQTLAAGKSQLLAILSAMR